MPRQHELSSRDAYDANGRLHHLAVGRSHDAARQGRVHMKPFDVVIQRGTNHAWVNKGKEPALLVAVLVDAKPLRERTSASSARARALGVDRQFDDRIQTGAGEYTWAGPGTANSFIGG